MAMKQVRLVFMFVALASLGPIAAGNIGDSQLAEDRLALTSIDGADDESMSPQRELAELQYKVGIRVVFSYDEDSQEYGLQQQGLVDRTGPLVRGEFESLLEVFLAITPSSVPVPRLLLVENPDSTLPDLGRRTITDSRVMATGLEVPLTISPSPAASQSCFDTYYDWWDWHDPAAAGMAPRTYYASEFSGKRRYSDSYVANCTPADSPSWLWARHRIYYKNAFGNYKKHYDSKVAPGHWDAEHKGSLVKRYRKVTYTDGWNSSPNCGGLVGITCKYTREGRFHD
jgi:hypothetical protein